jgi:CRP/FNR family cyclic AMP-dependent transcriptional regulator
MIDTSLLRKIELFASLEPLHLAHLASIGRELALPKDEIIFEEGEVGTDLYVVADGSVRISKIVPGIGEEALAILRAGSYFGEMEFADRSIPRAARALAHERTLLYCFSYTELDDLLGTDRDLALAIKTAMLRTLVRRLRATNDKVTAMFAMAQFG